MSVSIVTKFGSLEAWDVFTDLLTEISTNEKRRQMPAAACSSSCFYLCSMKKPHLSKTMFIGLVN